MSDPASGVYARIGRQTLYGIDQTDQCAEAGRRDGYIAQMAEVFQRRIEWPGWHGYSILQRHSTRVLPRGSACIRESADARRRTRAGASLSLGATGGA